MKLDRTAGVGEVDQGEELGKKWFGAFIAIEPGQTGRLSFSYLLPNTMSEKIKNGSYTLFVQKQLGLPEMGLTLWLDFGNNSGMENNGDFVGSNYSYTGVMREDLELVYH